MEAFLTTLPPYVHQFLNKQPATDVFNVLRELICFAVLYSEDRDKIRQTTDDLLNKKRVEEEEKKEEEDEEEIVEEPQAIENVETLKEKTKIVSTMPSWWGHQEFVPTKPKKQTRTPSLWETQEVPLEQPTVKERVPSLWECPEAQVPEKKTQPLTRQHTLWEVPEVEDEKSKEEKKAPMWVSYEKPEERDYERRGFEKRASSQVVIPNLRSYNDDTHPVSKKEEGSKTAVKKVAKEDAPKRTPSTIKLPRQNAAVRARAEHAKQRQQEANVKPASAVSPMTQRIKQRASSGINWDTIKQERRKTLTTEK